MKKLNIDMLLDAPLLGNTVYAKDKFILQWQSLDNLYQPERERAMHSTTADAGISSLMKTVLHRTRRRRRNDSNGERERAAATSPAVRAGRQITRRPHPADNAATSQCCCRRSQAQTSAGGPTTHTLSAHRQTVLADQPASHLLSSLRQRKSSAT